jgi:hypothetical protein
LEFSSIFRAFKTISRFSGIVFALKINSEKTNPILSNWGQPEGPTHLPSARRWPSRQAR